MPCLALPCMNFMWMTLRTHMKKIEDTEFGGFLSARKRDEDWPIIMRGQDK